MKTNIKTMMLFTLSFFINNFNYAQVYTLYSEKTFGGNGTEQRGQLINSRDNQLLISGASNTNIDGDKTDPLCTGTNYDIWLLKIDTGFNIIWNKSIGGDYIDEVPQLIKTNNSYNMIFSCDGRSDSSCYKSEFNRSYPMIYGDYWIGMLDSNGNKLWDKTFGGTDHDIIPHIIQLTTGDFIVAGISNSPVSGDKTVSNFGSWDFWVIKIDSIGNKLWDKVYGGTGVEQQGSTLNFNTMAVLEEPMDNFILAGSTNSPISGTISDSCRGNSDIWIIRLGATGTPIWDRRFGGNKFDDLVCIKHTKYNGYIVCGSTPSIQSGDVSEPSKGLSDVWVLKLDSTGHKQWDKRYGGADNEFGSWIEPSPGGGYWVSATTFSVAGIDVTEPPFGTSDYWIFKIDDNGNKVWDKRFGGPEKNTASNFLIMPDTSIFLIGVSETGLSAVKTDSGKGGDDFWVVHFKYADTTSVANAINEHFNDMNISPNPTSGIIKINSRLQGEATISVDNLLGACVYKNKMVMARETTLNFSSLPAGVYFLKVQNEKYVKVIKFLKQ